MSTIYPKSPVLKDFNVLAPSSGFRKSAGKVIASIGLFLLSYAVLVALAIGLLIGSIYAGIAIIEVKIGFITLAASTGIMVLGIMFFLFLFKFIFTSNKDENPNRLQVTKQQHPELFEFIEQLTQDTQTKFPKKIFLSPDVNACVFYNSSFWSLLFPVRKNLEIGLGLVNTLTISELKAVLAHEFGHFSQRSMKVGSYIYIVNKVIYNMVYEYDSWDNLLSKWAETGGIFGFFAGITFWMAERVRGMLKFAYGIMNKNYMALSREMEYHADLVAASVSGNKSFVSALRNIEFSSYAYEYAINGLNSLTNKNKASDNIYENHSHVVRYLTDRFGLTTSGDTLVIKDEDLEKNMVKTRVIIKDQWASHPDRHEREENLKKVNIKCVDNDSSAWQLFNDKNKLQQLVSTNLYKIGFPDAQFENLSLEDFKNELRAQIDKYSISNKYNEFYDNRYISELRIKEVLNQKPEFKNFEGIYSKENTERIKRHQLNNEDLNLLEMIKTGSVEVKHFDFDGKKHKKKDVSKIIDILKKEIEKDEEFIKKLDKEAFLVNLNNARVAVDEPNFVSHYQNFFSLQSKIIGLDDQVIKLQNLTNKIYSKPRWNEEEFEKLLNEISSFENGFKRHMTSIDLSKYYDHIESKEQRDIVNEYFEENQNLIKLSAFEEEQFIMLSNIVYSVQGVLMDEYGLKLKELTDYQLMLAGSKVIAA